MKKLTIVCIIFNALVVFYIYFNTKENEHDMRTVKASYITDGSFRIHAHAPPKETVDLTKIPKHSPHRAINCSALFAGDTLAQKKAMIFMQNSHAPAPELDDQFSGISCPAFVKQRSYITSPLSEEEAAFPIAYSLVIFKDLAQVERLFRAIYRPQNFYCFHVDKKASEGFGFGARRLASCFPNAFVASRSVDVKWGTWTVLEADLICMQELLRRFPGWKYLINLTGQEFPLRTNLELVRILKALNGSNSMPGSVTQMNSWRIPAEDPGFNVTWVKGPVHIAGTRAFFEFLFGDAKARRITQLLKNLYYPEETLFATLNHNPGLGTPGAYLGWPDYEAGNEVLTRFKNWGNYPCLSGFWAHTICIFGVLDLTAINRRPELFLNKVYRTFQPLTLDCLEERIFNHTRRDYGGRSATSDEVLDLSFYRNLSIAKNHQ